MSTWVCHCGSPLSVSCASCSPPPQSRPHIISDPLPRFIENEDAAVVRWLRGQANLYRRQTPDARNVALAILACANGIERGEHR